MADCQNNMRTMRRQTYRPSNTPHQCSCQVEGCLDTQDFLSEYVPLAMAYVRWQKWRDLYEPCKAFQCGTIFRELDKPFRGKGGRCR